MSKLKTVCVRWRFSSRRFTATIDLAVDFQTFFNVVNMTLFVWSTTRVVIAQRPVAVCQYLSAALSMVVVCIELYILRVMDIIGRMSVLLT